MDSGENERNWRKIMVINIICQIRGAHHDESENCEFVLSGRIGIIIWSLDLAR